MSSKSRQDFNQAHTHIAQLLSKLVCAEVLVQMTITFGWILARLREKLHIPPRIIDREITVKTFSHKASRTVRLQIQT